MKNCPSCGSELAEDALECLCGHAFTEGEGAVEEELESTEPALTEEPEDEQEDEQEEGDSEEDQSAEDEIAEDGGPSSSEDWDEPEVPRTKSCVFCMSEIAAPAARCPHCAGFLPIAEGTIFKQYFFFLFACLAMTVGTLLPWERSYIKFNLTGVDSIGGAFLLVLSIYGIFASLWNIYHRKMIVWPVILAALDGALLGWTRLVQITKGAQIEITAASEFGQMVQRVKGYLASYGPGLYLVVIFSTLVILSIFLSVFKGAKEDSKRKSEERDARAAARAARRS